MNRGWYARKGCDECRQDRTDALDVRRWVRANGWAATFRRTRHKHRSVR